MGDMIDKDAVLAILNDYVQIGSMVEAIAALPTQADAPMKCAECDCDNPPHGCNWIKSGPSLADALAKLAQIKKAWEGS